jgi:hypothetical protein
MSEPGDVRIDTRDHTGLVELSIHFGLELRDGETDAELRKRLHRHLAATQDLNRFSLVAIDSHVTETIDDHRAAFIEVSQVKRSLAIYWLRADRPSSFFARLAWVWRTMLLLWRKP